MVTPATLLDGIDTELALLAKIQPTARPAKLFQLRVRIIEACHSLAKYIADPNIRAVFKNNPDELRQLWKTVSELDVKYATSIKTTANLPEFKNTDVRDRLRETRRLVAEAYAALFAVYIAITAITPEKSPPSSAGSAPKQTPPVDYSGGYSPGDPSEYSETSSSTSPAVSPSPSPSPLPSLPPTDVVTTSSTAVSTVGKADSLPSASQTATTIDVPAKKAIIPAECEPIVFTYPSAGSHLLHNINFNFDIPWQGVVSNYLEFEQYMGIQVDCFLSSFAYAGNVYMRLASGDNWALEYKFNKNALKKYLVTAAHSSLSVVGHNINIGARKCKKCKNLHRIDVLQYILGDDVSDDALLRLAETVVSRDCNNNKINLSYDSGKSQPHNDSIVANPWTALYYLTAYVLRQLQRTPGVLPVKRLRPHTLAVALEYARSKARESDESVSAKVTAFGDAIFGSNWSEKTAEFAKDALSLDAWNGLFALATAYTTTEDVRTAKYGTYKLQMPIYTLNY